MDTGECLGNVVSDGKLVRDSGGIQNAQFGIRKDGTMVFGYLSEEDVVNQSNPFVQLVSGVVWLLRNGEVYINQSRVAECGDTQTTGTFDKFINVISARTAVGHDRQGRLILVHVDGQTESRGVSLWEMAEFLKQQGVINAINLDGGGSATLVLNGTLASYPSEHCPFDSMWRCPRSISTVVCVHEPACDPPDCSGHGLCVAGHCHCDSHFWAGPACDTLDCGPANCSLHGVCSASCAPGSYGESCSQKCQCQHGSSCDPVHGACSCPAGFYGSSCEHAGQCLASQKKSNEKFSLSESAWVSLSCALALLLVLSVLGNVGLVLRGRQQHRKQDYCYHPLRDINGDTPHCPTSAAWDQEEIQQLEDTQEPNQEFL
ncbi:N-acetylglucosamine-1-phosphodiester alpha-N-acetylglucosaminidase [Turdus rufiventris]|nr:N-acetylglucosamine-1-phosphodiester alpha-N-acetylglucosaminidase [Turdus rufiventris]